MAFRLTMGVMSEESTGEVGCGVRSRGGVRGVMGGITPPRDRDPILA